MFDTQVVGQLWLPLHRKGAQAGVPTAPAAIAEHVPPDPGAVHVAQLPVQAVSQQTPPTQKPEMQLAPTVQKRPLAEALRSKISAVPRSCPERIPPAASTRPSWRSAADR